MATKVYVVYYSTYGHVERLEQEIKKGAESVEGVEAKLLQLNGHYVTRPSWYDFCAHWLHIWCRGMFKMESVKGGSPYGAGTYTGDGSRQPSELKLGQAFYQGKYIAAIAKKLKGNA